MNTDRSQARGAQAKFKAAQPETVLLKLRS